VFLWAAIAGPLRAIDAPAGGSRRCQPTPPPLLAPTTPHPPPPPRPAMTSCPTSPPSTSTTTPTALTYCSQHTGGLPPRGQAGRGGFFQRSCPAGVCPGLHSPNTDGASGPLPAPTPALGPRPSRSHMLPELGGPLAGGGAVNTSRLQRLMARLVRDEEPAYKRRAVRHRGGAAVGSAAWLRDRLCAAWLAGPSCAFSKTCTA
jgi:hypothetical protein